MRFYKVKISATEDVRKINQECVTHKKVMATAELNTVHSIHQLFHHKCPQVTTTAFLSTVNVRRVCGLLVT
jgi:hypothetical protein